MPRNASKPKLKLKTHRGARKRFKITANGKIKRGHSGKRHLMGTKAPGRMRKLKKLTLVSKADVASIKQMLPYQVNSKLMSMTNNPNTKFMHCLPALHNTDTRVGKKIYEKYGLEALEVTDEVFESKASIVFDQAENRLHCQKALLLMLLAPGRL